MTKEKVRYILNSFVQQQLMAIAGGIVGGDENVKFANEDLKTYQDAFNWFDKTVMKKQFKNK